MHQKWTWMQFINYPAKNFQNSISQIGAKARKIVVKPADETRFVQEIKAPKKNYNIITWY